MKFPQRSPPAQPESEEATWKTDDTDADADADADANTYTGRADQAKISFRHSKKIDDDYDNDNRSACAPLTTTELQASKGCGGGFDAGDSSGKRDLMREAPVKERRLRSNTDSVAVPSSRFKTAPADNNTNSIVE
ncbi:MAG TPA: hypothetical protein ENN79_03935, partial [Desulfobacteraceae bacterium]|nr:hypothetical protein [Desulfobacteraceae bacterium]